MAVARSCPRSILRLFRRPNVAASSARMHRLTTPSRFLHSYRARAPSRWGPSAPARRDAPPVSPPFNCVPRFPHGSWNMDGSSGAEDGELGKPNKRCSIPSAKALFTASNDIRNSLGKLFPITRDMDKEENWGKIEEFIAPYGDGCLADGEDSRRKQDPGEVTDGDRDVNETADDFIAYCSDDGGSSDGEARGQSASDVSDSEEYSSWLAENTFCFPDDGVPDLARLDLSTHRDGAIYRGKYHWRKHFRIADRNETGLDAIPIKQCILKGETCLVHSPSIIWQIFSLKLVKTPVDGGSVHLYGYIAARDDLDPLLNYVVNISRDDPIIVEQGSLIEITGPKRSIDLSSSVLIEYDMRIKTGDREKDDLQLIDGAAIINELVTSAQPFTVRILGKYGAVDMNQLCMFHAVVAAVEVGISEVQSPFDLCISCFTSGFRDEIRLFNGVVGESRGFGSHVIAVLMDTCLDLKFKVGSGSCYSFEHCLSFKAMIHGCPSEELNIEFASVSVKVVWSTL